MNLWQCPECLKEITCESNGLQYACGDCSERPWDEDGVTVDMVIVSSNG